MEQERQDLCSHGNEILMEETYQANHYLENENMVMDSGVVGWAERNQQLLIKRGTILGTESN